MPEVTKEAIGRRMFQIHKDKSVEKVIQKLRDTIGPDWKSFTEDEIRLLERLLGIAWANFEQSLWEKIPFASMTKDDVGDVIAIGKCIDLEKTSPGEVVENLKKILLCEACPT